MLLKKSQRSYPLCSTSQLVQHSMQGMQEPGVLVVCNKVLVELCCVYCSVFFPSIFKRLVKRNSLEFFLDRNSHHMKKKQNFPILVNTTHAKIYCARKKIKL